MNLLDATPPPDTPYKIARLYLKGASVEVPHMANLPSVAIAPEIGVDMQTEATPAWPGALECVLRISLHARLQGKDVFMVEVSEAAVFELDLSNVEDAHRFVRKIAPSVLFPFARKDLANLTVAAGFQPVLLDHVDFDSMLTKVMQAQRITRAPAPMRLDVIAAKPEAAAPALTSAPVAAAQASAQPEQAADSEWPDTTPLAEPFEFSSHTGGGGRRLALALLGVAAMVATVAWYLQPHDQAPQPTLAVAPAAPRAAPVASATATATAPVPASAPAPVQTATALAAPLQAAIETSRARLSEQPAGWFTLDLGTVPANSPLASFNALPQQRALFVLPAKGSGLRLLYGVFATQAAAESARSQLPQGESEPARQTAIVTQIGAL